MLKQFIMTSALVSSAALAAQAQETVATEDFSQYGPASGIYTVLADWQAEVEFGFSNSNGNTNETELAAAISAEREWEKYLLELDATANGRTDEGDRAAEKYTFNAVAGYKFNDRTYGYGELDWVKDLFSGYNYQLSTIAGVGYKAIQQENMNLDLRLGAGLRQSETDTNPTNEETEGVIKPELKFDWAINEYVSFTQELSSEIGGEFTRTESESAIESKLTNNLFLKAKYELTHLSDVPVNTKQTDTKTSINFVYKFQ